MCAGNLCYHVAVRKPKTGNIVILGGRAVVDRAELRTIYTLQSWPGLQSDIELLPTRRDKGYKTPDIRMNGLEWEIKNPKGKGKYVISRNLYHASKQSANIILDLRRMPGSYKHYLSEIQREFMNNPRAKRLLVITKAQAILDFVK